MIDYDENKAQMQNRSHRYDINRPRPGHGTNILIIKCVPVR